MKKTIQILTMSLLASAFLWGYSPRFSIDEIKSILDNRTDGQTTGLYKKDGIQYMNYLNQYLATDEQTFGDWMFRFTTLNGSIADISLNFSARASSTEDTIPMDLHVNYAGETFEGIVSGIPKQEPTKTTSFSIAFNNGDTGVLTYDPGNQKLSINID